MNKRESFLTRQRQLVPPPSLRSDVERSVMAGIAHRRPVSHRFRVWAVGFSTALAVVIGVLIVRDHRTTPLIFSEAQFVESTIILDDHVCIWLEPLDLPSSRRPIP